MRFLVVDDSATMRRILVNSLQRIGYDDFVEAASGAEALERLDASVQFIITDWSMPGLSGVELARALRASSPSVPVLMVTTRSSREELMAALQAGVSHYIVKPFTPQVLKERIEAALAGQPAAA